jgi:hypothetical protein
VASYLRLPEFCQGCRDRDLDLVDDRSSGYSISNLCK